MNEAKTDDAAAATSATNTTDLTVADIVTVLRTREGLTQDEMAAKLFVTRQAVSRWETGETVPSTDTLKLMSQTFNISIDTLLGQTQNLCQSCGMPLTDADLYATNADGSPCNHYCKWCYTNGEYITDCTMDEMIEMCIPHMSGWTPDDARAFMRKTLPFLERWKPAGETVTTADVAEAAQQ